MKNTMVGFNIIGEDPEIAPTIFKNYRSAKSDLILTLSFLREEAPGNDIAIDKAIKEIEALDDGKTHTVVVANTAYWISYR